MLPHVLRPPARYLLRSWGRLTIAPGYYDHTVEVWGGSLASEPLEARLFNGCVVRCDLGEHIQRQIYYYGAYEFIEAYLFDRLAQPGMVVVDAGANIGQYSLIAGRRVGSSGYVHAFEPVPGNARRLEAHIARNGLSGVVRANRLALWDDERMLTMHLTRVDRQKGNATNFSAGESPDAVETVVCQARRLDDYAREVGFNRFDLLKIDVEGAELRALRGAGDLLERFRPTILMEVNREAATTTDAGLESLWEFLRPLGYRVLRIGLTAEGCEPLDRIDGIDRANVLLHVGELPEVVRRGWTLKGVMRQSLRAAMTPARTPEGQARRPRLARVGRRPGNLE